MVTGERPCLLSAVISPPPTPLLYPSGCLLSWEGERERGGEVGGVLNVCFVIIYSGTPQTPLRHEDFFIFFGLSLCFFPSFFLHLYLSLSPPPPRNPLWFDTTQLSTTRSPSPPSLLPSLSPPPISLPPPPPTCTKRGVYMGTILQIRSSLQSPL